ncbi:UDP-glucose dehydrogenase family protein [Streptomyces sp. NPDC051658]|uniref:UDP-glucose dehydrogenase family protein n=1 Tax=Streptomyces sp. NPDC051658 TaxID=3365667 RepID=UPI0037B10E39
MTLKISVIGTNYLGANTAVGMAEFGFDVLGVDINNERVKTLNAGIPPLYEPGLEPLLQKHIESGRLRFTTDYSEIADWADIHFICVGTPQKSGENDADLSQLDAVVSTLAPLLTKSTLVVGRSTVPVGTSARVEHRLRSLSPSGTDVSVAWQPEFLREAHGVEDTLRPDRLVFGVNSLDSERSLRTVFAQPIAKGCPVLVTNRETAELVKVAANSFLATKISFINAMADVCDAVGADVTLLADAIGHDVRIGRGMLNAGPGYGGGCLPKDLRAFIARASELGSEPMVSLLTQVDHVNSQRRAQIVKQADALLQGSGSCRRVAVLGAAFKAGTDDVRDSPALEIATELQARGAVVRVFDPKAVENARRMYPGLDYAESVEDACQAANLVVHLTEWPEFRELDPHHLKTTVADPILLDARLVLDPAAWTAAGWVYRAPGIPSGN